MSFLQLSNPSTPSSFLRKNTGSKIATIRIPSLSNETASKIKPEAFKELASYNWIDSDTPTIVAPGAPPKWTPKALPIRIQQDSGLYYIDQNRYRCTTFPLEPLFRSIYTLDPHFDPKPIDLFTDRNNLRKLTFAVSGISIQDFRIEVELVGDTLLFTRSEEQASEVVTQFRGFGHQFERKFTDYDDSALKKSTGHHRIVQQSVGGITFVVRFEVDGYFEEENTVPRDSKSDDRDEISDLATSLASMQVRQSRTLKVLRGGYKVSPNSLLELKTRAKHRPLHTSDVIYQLWFGQVPWLVVAYHMRGAFSQIKKEDFKDTGKFANFEAENKVEVTKLVRVIKNIKEALKKAGKTRGIVVYERELVLYEMSGNARSLPEDLLKKWE